MTLKALSVRRDGQVIVAGSIAFDQIMLFPGKFEDHILPEKLHVINISFLVSEMRLQRGGCAGNIGYSLALLGVEARLVAAAGDDFGPYRDWLDRHGIDTSQIAVHDDIRTATCFITSDRSNNQITGFYPGAMARASQISLAASLGERPALVIIAPDDPGAMARHCREARGAGIPFFFDPSFQVTAMDGPALAEAAAGATALLVNYYEHAVFEEKTGKKGSEIFDLVDMVIVTLGGEGSKILFADGGELRIPAARIDCLADPTGAGDAFRAGFIAGLMRGYDLATCGRMGSVASAFVVEQSSPQLHAYTREEFEARYEENFGPLREVKEGLSRQGE